MDSVIKAPTSNVKLGVSRQLGYGMGEFAGQFFFSYWSSYLSVYYTDIVGFAPAIVSIIFMIARVWDAINDPIMGNIADRHRHKKYGRYRPWILFGTPFLGILSIILFCVPQAAGYELKIIFATITYMIAGTAFTVVNIPYMSLQSTLTTNVRSRSDLSNMKGAFTCIGAALINLIAMSVITRLGGGKVTAHGFLMGTIVFTLMGIAAYYISFASTEEIYFADAKETHVSFKEMMHYLFSNRALVAVMFAILLGMLAMFGRLGVAVYYYLYCVKTPQLIGVLMVVPILCAVIPTYLVPKINISRKKLIIISFIGQAFFLFLLYFIDYSNLTAIVACLAFYGVFTFSSGMLSALIAPAIDDAEIKSGIRLDGTAYAIVNLFAKLASAMGGAIGLAIMGYMGYVANTEQSAASLNGINIATNVVPGVFALLAIIPILLYDLDFKKMEENARLLAERKSGN